MKRLLGMILAILLTIAPLASCGGGNGGDNSKPDSSGTVSSDTVSGDTTGSSTVDSDTTGSSTVDSDTTDSSTVDSDATDSGTVDSNADIRYKVNYYLQNIENDNYTLDSTDTLYGKAGDRAEAVVKSYAHFTLNGGKSSLNGTISGDGSLVLKVYYTRDTYKVVTGVNNSIRGAFTRLNGDYKYGKQLTVTATAKDGYTFEGWFENGNLVTKNSSYAFTVTRGISLEARFGEESKPKYIVNYYLQNIENDSYTLDSTDTLYGKAGDRAEAEVKSYAHFTLNEGKSSLYGTISGDGNLVLNVYYDREVYLVITTSQNDVSHGNFTRLNHGHRYGKQLTVTATANDGYIFEGWFENGNLVSTSGSYTFTMDRCISLEARFGEESKPKYIVNYYLQNIENDSYTLDSTDTLYGKAGDRAEAEVKSYAHFTLNEGKSSLYGTISGDGNLVLNVYYDREVYLVTTTSQNDESYGSFTRLNHGYRYGKQLTITATANDGYIFKGWYENGSLVSDKNSYAFTVDRDISLTASFIVDIGVKYTISYYLQNLRNDGYTLEKTETYYGEIGLIIELNILKREHYVANLEKGKLSGVIVPDGSLALSLYYDREVYTVSIGDGDSTGAVTGEGSYKYGTAVTLTAVRPAKLGYAFLGWESDGYETITDTNVTIEIDRNLTAVFGIDERMEIFDFTSTETECIITGLKEKSLTNIFVPSYVTKISQSAFEGCTALTELTLPFVGENADLTGKTHFGYIFGASSYSYNSSYVPSSLKKVTITGGKIGYSAFYGCKGLTEIIISNSVTYIDWHAFSGCTGLTEITLPLLVLNADGTGNFGYIFGASEYSENSSYVPSSLRKVTITGGKVGSYAFSGCTGLTSVTISEGVTSIGEYAFDGCTGLKSVTIEEGVTSIGDYAFSGCKGLTEVTILSSVTYIGNYAFEGCTGLTAVHITDLSSWCKISFDDSSSNPLYYAKNLYLNGELVTNLVIPNDVTRINAYAFYSCESIKSVDVPSSVTSIYYSAFSGCTGLTEITIPSSVTSIGWYTFEGCTSLKSVTIEEGVTGIGPYAFRDCTGLTEITIPSSVTSIYSSVFEGCSHLNELTLPFIGEKADGTGATYLGYIFGASSYSENSKYVPSRLKKVTVTGDKIGDYAFDGCKYLTSITIGTGIKSMVNNAFGGCTSLAELTIPFVGQNADGTGATYFGYIFGDSSYSERSDYVPSGLRKVTIAGGKIDDYAFYRWNCLTSVTIEQGVTGLGNSAFSGCTGLTKITIPNSVTEIGSYAFGWCDDLTEVTIPQSVTSIGSYAFLWCTDLTEVTIPQSVTSIGPRAFSNCTGLTEITLPFVGEKADGTGETHFGYIFGAGRYSYNGDYVPSSLKKVTITGGNIGSCAFYGCTSLTEVTIPSSVTSIDYYAFEGCRGLTAVHITDISAWYKISFSSYSSNPLYYAKNLYVNGELLTNLVIPNDVIEIKEYAFYNCESLKSVEIPSSVTGVGNYAFSGCTGLTEVTIPSSVTGVGDYAFSGCTGLTSATIPSSVTGVGNSAFSGCTGLTSVTIPRSVTSIGSGAFSGCTGLTSVTIPSSVKSIGDSAFYGCTGLTSVTIPSSVTSIGIGAFGGCTGLSEITLPFVGQSADGTGNTHFGYIFGANYCSENSSYVPSSLKKVTITGGKIGDSAFYGCTGLTEVTIPSSVTSIGYYAFEGCTGLKTVYYGGTETEWSSISIGSGNSCLTSAKIYYNSEQN